MGRVIKAAPPLLVIKSDLPRVAMSTEIIAVAVEMAKRIVADEIDETPSRLGIIYARALRSAQGLDRAKVYVHPSDRTVFDIDNAASAIGFTVDEDESVGRGGCRIVGRLGEVDASIDAITKSFLETMKDA